MSAGQQGKDTGAAASPVSGHDGLPSYDARDLTAGGQTAEILLGDQVYTLRITKAGKLILTK
ncbi:hemin uptake protein HemP [Pseudooceanicola sp. LIPI14-2-Ac024]|uniref:hemin uptake protein HemP n=1 Tax=Pseudooceanicola sp. LIPI14-2-Ac024 TaxID=3344875 RepID=UPI0035CEC765